MRAVFRDGKSTYEQLLNKAKYVAKLTTLYEGKQSKTWHVSDVYKVKHGLCPQSVKDLFSENSTGFNFRYYIDT